MEPNAFDAMIDAAAEEAAKVLDGVVEEVVQQVAEDRKDGCGCDAVAAVERNRDQARHHDGGDRGRRPCRWKK